MIPAWWPRRDRPLDWRLKTNGCRPRFAPVSKRFAHLGLGSWRPRTRSGSGSNATSTMGHGRGVVALGVALKLARNHAGLGGDAGPAVEVEGGARQSTVRLSGRGDLGLGHEPA